jgi:hypothetical protein
MSERASYSKREGQRFARGCLTGVKRTLGAAGGLLCIAILLRWLFALPESTISSIAARVQIVYAFATILLTVALAAVTYKYVEVTRRMLTEMTDSRRASIRPLILAEVSNPSVTDDPDRPDQRTIALDVTVSNLASTVALGVNAEIMVPQAGRQPDRSEWLDTSVHANLILPPVLHPHSQASYRRSVNTERYPIKDGVAESFMRLQIRFEDLHGNLYTQIQEYNLAVVSNLETGCLYWIPAYEALRMLPAGERRYTMDSCVTSVSLDQKLETIYERIGP